MKDMKITRQKSIARKRELVESKYQVTIDPFNEYTSEYDKIITWLGKFKSEYLIREFISSGFDDLNYINGIITDEALIKIGLRDEEVETIMANIKELPLPQKLKADDYKRLDAKLFTAITQTVAYLPQLINKGYNCYDTIITLNDIALIVDLRVYRIGHRKRILYYVEQFKTMAKPTFFINREKSHEEILLENQKSQNICSTGVRYRPKSFFRNKNPALNESSKISKKDNTCTVRSKKNSDNFSHKPKKQEQLNKSTPVIEIHKKPSMKNLLKSFRVKVGVKPNVSSMPSIKQSKHLNKEFLKKKSDKIDEELSIDQMKLNIDHEYVWIHDINLLLNGFLTFKVQYLGMRNIENIYLKNKKMVEKSFEDLKLSAPNFNLFPEFTLNISAKMVQIRELINQNLISTHRIRSILFCSQDPADLRVFCFVHFDKPTLRVTCFVFKSNSVKLAGEILLALGLAFQINSNID